MGQTTAELCGFVCLSLFVSMTPSKMGLVRAGPLAWQMSGKPRQSGNEIAERCCIFFLLCLWLVLFLLDLVSVF